MPEKEIIFKDLKISKSARTVDTHISKLRKKLMHAACYIEAVYAEGYRCAV